MPALRPNRPIFIIGAGSIVRSAHLPAYEKAGFRVHGVYDIDPGKAESLAQKTGIRGFSGSLETALTVFREDVVFDVAVPASALFSVLLQLPENSVVLMQKPMGETLAAAKDIVRTCAYRHFVAAVNFQLRYAPCIVAARSMIEKGLIGQLHDLEIRVTVETPWDLWTFLEQAPRLEILYHSVHYVDLIRSFLGDPLSVHAKTTRHPKMSRLQDTRSGILLDYGDTTRATITTNHGHAFGRKHQESYVKWEGTEGALRATLGALLDYPRGIPDELECCGLSGEDALHWNDIPISGNWFPDAFIGTMASVQDFAAGLHDSLPTSVEDACRTMAVVEAAYLSSERGGTAIPLCSDDSPLPGALSG